MTQHTDEQPVSVIMRICPINDGSTKYFAISEKEVQKLQIIHEKASELIPTLATIAEQTLMNVMEREVKWPQ